ncbi:T9SS type A sorting domain-containing protein [Moheibacter sediminis]|uniref:Por secretion system C-terminal sorting domain-containing protein n=1 Tax=Moheibacter sediminis TaxID=1434700 RepID=A0A1W2AXD9_9FLAO|nr:T9SS type A sorting domain-containing protein [Moheibacter sediminis]SMC65131.1 Por secretion system C-terminal sorting domain-containing protein [Moheibacter sediminis]
MKRFFTKLLILPCLMSAGFLSAQDVLFSEGFDYTPGPLPSQWMIEAEQPPGWSINNSQISGGTAPELYMTYGMQVGLSRLVSPVIDVAGYEKLAIRYKQYLINYLGDWGETIGMDVTFDGGANWQPLWEKPLGLLNIPQDEFSYFVTAPTGATEMKIAFRFEGNNQGINGWAIDDIIVEDATNNDLLVTNITANTTPKVGEPSFFMAEVQNGGKTTQSNYTVKLMTEENAGLASAIGQPVEFGEKAYIMLNTWIPSEGQIGTHKVYAIVDFAQDENSDNNQSKSVVIDVVPSGTENVQIGTGSYTLQHSIPYNFFNLNSLSQSMYLSSQIGEVEESSSITGIQYTCQFDEDVQDVPIQIYLAETTQTDLANDWVDPATFTLVYDGLMDFQKGLNSHYIELDTPYDYQGGNLVIYSNKTYSEQVLWSTFISTYDENTIYSRMIDWASEPYDPMSPPDGYMVFYTPNINLFFSSGQMSVIDNDLNSFSLSVYPNPASEIINIKSHNEDTILEVQLINSLGQIVSKKSVNDKQTTLNVKALKAGFYLVQVKTSNGFITKKFIKK